MGVSAKYQITAEPLTQEITRPLYAHIWVGPVSPNSASIALGTQRALAAPRKRPRSPRP